MTSLGPLEVVICWQSMVLSIIVYAAVQSVKNALLAVAGSDEKKVAWVKGSVLPLLPLAFGAMIACFFPLKPDAVVQWAEKSDQAYASFAVWGACVGQFSDYLHTRINGMLMIREAHKAPVAPVPALAVETGRPPRQQPGAEP